VWRDRRRFARSVPSVADEDPARASLWFLRAMPAHDVAPRLLADYLERLPHAPCSTQLRQLGGIGRRTRTGNRLAGAGDASPEALARARALALDRLRRGRTRPCPWRSEITRLPWAPPSLRSLLESISNDERGARGILQETLAEEHTRRAVYGRKLNFCLAAARGDAGREVSLRVSAPPTPRAAISPCSNPSLPCGPRAGAFADGLSRAVHNSAPGIALRLPPREALTSGLTRPARQPSARTRQDLRGPSAQPRAQHGPQRSIPLVSRPFVGPRTFSGARFDDGAAFDRPALRVDPRPSRCGLDGESLLDDAGSLAWWSSSTGGSRSWSAIRTPARTAATSRPTGRSTRPRRHSRLSRFGAGSSSRSSTVSGGLAPAAAAARRMRPSRAAARRIPRGA
jgi:hypothetical protein